jgi:hypothetical protein
VELELDSAVLELAGVHIPLIHDETDEYPSPMAVPTIRTCQHGKPEFFKLAIRRSQRQR